MTRADAISRLQQHADAIKAKGATALYLFGSTVRNEAQPASDLDLFVDHGAGFSLLDLVGIQQLLEEELVTSVDVTTRGSLHPQLKADIEQSAIRVF